jgi:methionyl-tRNA formyltransferase
MRILLLANNWGGWQVCRWLRERDENVVGLVVHPASDGKYRDQVLEAARMPDHLVRTADQLKQPVTIEFLRSLKPDIALSAFFAYIIKPEVLAIPPLGCVNLHPAYLPYNRGMHPNVWPLMDGTPVGVTVHYVDKGVDTGDVIARRLIEVKSIDTGGTLHQRLTRELVQLFEDTWPSIRAGTNARIPQDGSVATFHLKKDMDPLDHIDLDKEYKARDLINLLRGRTYPPFPAAYFFDENGRKVYVRTQLFYEEDLPSNGVPAWDDEEAN